MEDLYARSKTIMRNKITLIDPNVPKIDIFVLQPGEMFKYVDNVNDGAYMKLDTSDGNMAVYLPTGMQYQIAVGKALQRITMLQITSPIS